MSTQTIQKRAPLLVELGTEELPPSALKTLAIAFHDHLLKALGEAGLLHEAHSRWFATPRRFTKEVQRYRVGAKTTNMESSRDQLLVAGPMRKTIYSQEFKGLWS